MEKETPSLDEWRSKAKRHRHREVGFTEDLIIISVVKNLSAMQATRVQSLSRDKPLEKGMAAHSSIFTWRIPRTEEPGGLQSMGSQRVGHG